MCMCVCVCDVTSCINVTATQAFEIKTQKDSSGEESDGSEMELDCEDDERASVLPDEEGDEADHTAEGGMTSLVASDGDGMQAMIQQSWQQEELPKLL